MARVLALRESRLTPGTSPQPPPRHPPHIFLVSPFYLVKLFLATSLTLYVLIPPTQTSF